MIEVENVSKWFEDFHVLKDCSTRVDKGEVVVVCGPSGSGKSTLIKCINGLEPFQEGVITVEVIDGKITHFYAMRNPEKLAGADIRREISRSV